MELLKPESKDMYGELVLQTRASTGRMVFRMIIALLPAIILLGAGIAMFISPDLLGPTEADWERFIPIGITIIGAIYAAIMIPFSLKQYSSDVFAKGFVLQKGAHITAHGFDDVAGVSYIIEKTSVNGIPTPGSTKTFTIAMKEGKGDEISVTPWRFNQHAQFAQAIDGLFTNQLLDGVTKESIPGLDIRFGAQLHMKNGVLNYKDGKAQVALADVTSMNTNDGFLTIFAMNDKGKEKAMINIGLAETYNRDVLFTLYDMVSGDKRKWN